MPIYEYRCARGHTFEVFQSMSEEPVATCVECDAPAERMLSAPAVHFKGSGFYTTDYARKGAKKAAGDGTGGDSDKAATEKSGEKKSETPAAKASGSEGSSGASSD